MRFRQFYENLFGDDFDLEGWKKEIKARGKIVSSKRLTRNDKLTLYHGFNRDPSSFNYEFDPAKSEQGLLWFTHNLIRGYDPKEYAASRGKYVLTHPLVIVKYTDVVTYENGSMEERLPEDMKKLAEPIKNSRYMLSFNEIIELPQGWLFTYKTEKFIGTSNKLKVTPNQIKLGEL